MILYLNTPELEEKYLIVFFYPDGSLRGNTAVINRDSSGFKVVNLPYYELEYNSGKDVFIFIRKLKT